MASPSTPAPAAKPAFIMFKLFYIHSNSMVGLHEFVYSELNDVDSLAVISTGRSPDEERNQWFYDVLEDFEEQGADVEGYWLGIPGQEDVDYDIEDNLFEYDFYNDFETDAQLLFVPRPGVLRYNPDDPKDDPLENYRSIAQKVDRGLDAALMTEVDKDVSGELPDVENMAWELSTDVAGSVVPVRQSSGSNSIFVKRGKV